MNEAPDVRRLSAAIFGNEKAVEVVAALAAHAGFFTAADVAATTGIQHGLVRAVLVRLAKDDVMLRAVPKTGSARGPQYYERRADRAWDELLTLTRRILATEHVSD